MPSYYQYYQEATWLLTKKTEGDDSQDNRDNDIVLKNDGEEGLPRRNGKSLLKMAVLTSMGCLAIIHGASYLHNAPAANDNNTDFIAPPQIARNVFRSMGNAHARKISKQKHNWFKKDKKGHNHVPFLSKWSPPKTAPRCDWVVSKFLERDEGTPPADLEVRYKAQSVDPNVFYRATAHVFWHDFAGGPWSKNFTSKFLLHNDPDSDDSKDEVDDDPDNKQQLDGVDLVRKSVWTWVTGDQHLSNFGAWRNRHGDIVFGVNDFDEAAIYDFQVDVIRIAVSICSHAVTNGLDKDQQDRALLTFTESYVQTILNYKGNENALLFELTPKTAFGSLKKVLKHTEKKKSRDKLMTKFTTRDPVTNKRHFIKGPIDVPHPDTHLASVMPEMVAQIKMAFNESHYGATMMKLGWAVLPWDDKFFTVLDVAERVGSGIGSYGVDRYYVLLKGRDGLLTDEGEDGTAVILDVKYQPKSAPKRVLEQDPETAAWYNTMFPNEAARVVEAQRRLTSYTDPFTGWVTLKNLDPQDETYGQYQAFSVRQRSPWKDSPDLDELTKPKDFYEFVAQIAVATATSHVRGSVAKAPGDFKNVIASVLGGSTHKRQEWGKIIALAAHAYREQVLMDFDCFRSYVQDTYGGLDDIDNTAVSEGGDSEDSEDE